MVINLGTSWSTRGSWKARSSRRERRSGTSWSTRTFWS